MKRILLVCAYGMSTSMLVARMEQEAKNIGFECSIEAMPVDTAVSEKKGLVDIVLVGPQVKYLYEKVKKEFDSVPVQMIDMVSYGRMDGKKVIEQVLESIGDK